MQDARWAERRQPLRPIRPEHQQRQREDQQFGGGENIDYYVDRKTGWRYCSRRRLHLQHRSGKAHNGKPVGAHGFPNLINGGDFGFLEEISEKSTGSVDKTHSHKTHVCGTVCSQRAPHNKCAWLKNCNVTCVSEKEFSHLVCLMSHPWLFSHALSFMNTSSSSFSKKPFLPHNENI